MRQVYKNRCPQTGPYRNSRVILDTGDVALNMLNAHVVNYVRYRVFPRDFREAIKIITRIPFTPKATAVNGCGLFR